MKSAGILETENEFKKLSEAQQFFYFHLLTLRKAKWDTESTAQAIIEAKVDLNPHQVEAATFAFRNPLAGGVILADEVGLGKTIETGIVLSQLWAEGKRSILIVAPKSLRHQWQDELKNLFGLTSSILETSSMRSLEKLNLANPFDSKDKIIITNEHFFNRFSAMIKSKVWDLVVIDEAHKLRNVWRPGKNQARRAKLIRETIRPFKKILLTATPMQNNLMELYGLTSFIEDSILGTPESFAQTFMRIPEEEREVRLSELRYRMQKFFHRELRRNVSDFIKYTKRNAVTFEFDPDDEEETLRKDFEAYLGREDILGIPPMASHLLKLIYCKLLASSSFALKNSLLGIYKRFVLHSVIMGDRILFDLLMREISASLSTISGVRSAELEVFEKMLFKNISPKNFDGLKASVVNSELIDLVNEEQEISDNYDEDDIEQVISDGYQKEEISHIKVLEEARQILEFIQLTKKIRENTKGDALKQALEKQFSQARDEGWPEKAVIFTEFKTTQLYVINVLEQMGLTLENDIVVFNGSVGDAESRRNLVSEFRDKKKIFLTTEAGAEGLNLQFCNLIINYDLPWNPQRIEQRIGRCHRYGQKLDVIVVNFINRKNHADRRVLELLGEKFHLFQGAFGVSDEVLGEIQSGNDIEKQILSLYLSCRTTAEIDERFQEMLEKNKDSVDARLSAAKEKLLSEFDEDVQKRLKDVHLKAKEAIDGRQSLVRDCILSNISPGIFTLKDSCFTVHSDCQGLKAGKSYTFLKSQEIEAELLHVGHEAFRGLKVLSNLNGHLKFNVSSGQKVSILLPYIKCHGSYQIFKFRIEGVESFDAIIPVFVIDGVALETEIAMRLLTVSSELEENKAEFVRSSLFEGIFESELGKLKQIMAENSEVLYHEEIEKIEFLFEDLERQKRFEKEELQKSIEDLKKERRSLPLQSQSSINSEISKLKDKLLKIDEEVARLSRDSRDREKSLISTLETKLAVASNRSLLGFGTFEIF